ncbi:uncharacterized protein LOC129585324 [Paramacrobiotus metropolitanus]|uniref:uncharacterized protein LOC129585324 n=1 Tax=Paramacrobiotus metropolitanus TaxID=2943436 RepID=UPI0024465A58|nr:uncharacterized protein LOC129585324 [Paramacrobiotus metropolitanus]XP_055333940.1 uncharacterized protein LOC129585324 [Paramacrobiotus metropolitanus]XP_055333941.1 uncharacterized protein LOC129585324 [Paramacrobiotus metropolitanus]XP_055333942.1 uncharacterized protein LOC129585324 [Paramacrobiotus metropolitanus]
MFKGKHLRMIALQDIPYYTGLHDIRTCDQSRFALKWPLQQRQEMFVKDYSLVCDCRKCTPAYEAEINPMKCITPGCPERIPSDERAALACPHCGAINEASLLKYKKFRKKHGKVFNAMARPFPSGYESDGMELMRERLCFLDDLDHADILHADSHLRFIIGWDVARWCEDTRRFERAAQLYRDMVPCLRIIYPKYHPHLAKYLHQAGRFAKGWYQFSDDKYFAVPVIKPAMLEAVHWLAESYKIYAQLLGEECDVACEIMDEIEKTGDMYHQLLRTEQLDVDLD